METIISSKTKSVVIGPECRFVIIGERINPTGRKRLAHSLAQGDMSIVRKEALAQAEAGAQVIDINVAAPEIDEERALPLAARTVADSVDLPLCIDTTHEGALAATLAVCPGKPLVNSVTGEDRSLKSALPLVKEYGAAVIGLCMDDEGIHHEAQRRLSIAEKIVNQAEKIGLHKEEVIIDPLSLTVGADNRAAIVTLRAIALIVQNLGVNTIVGASNVSFGLPDRPLINRTFLAMAIAIGLTCAIADPLDVEIRKAVATSDLLMGRDEYAMRFLAHSRAGWKEG